MPELATQTIEIDACAEVRAIASVLLRQSAGLVRTSSRKEVVAGLCDALTNSTPNIPLAWTWFGAKDTRQIRPQIIGGMASAYAKELVIDLNQTTRQGPAFRALAGERCSPTVVSPSSPFEPWRRAATLYGIRSSLALPLQPSANKESGIFVIYARDPHYFESVGVSLFESLAELFAALLSAASEKRALVSDAHSDALTGLGNRRMMHAAERGIYRQSTSSQRASVLVIDIDYFKQINDRHGHAAGDQVLRDLAARMLSRLRSGDTLVRWGGEEFVVCLPNAGLEDALQIAENIRAEAAASAFVEDEIFVTLSIGVVELEVGMSLSSAIGAADAALFSAKGAGRNCVRFASPS